MERRNSNERVNEAGRFYDNQYHSGLLLKWLMVGASRVGWF